MNWIGRWCKSKCTTDNDCDHCSELCLPRFNIAHACGISEYLVWILMNEQGGVTHPEIADDIADYLGASVEERDSIVHSIHRGTWQPGKHKKKPVMPFMDGRGGHNAIPVVAIDKTGREIARFYSAAQASIVMGCSDGTVLTVCKRAYPYTDEFKRRCFTFRYSDEWDAMTNEERLADLKIAKPDHSKECAE